VATYIHLPINSGGGAEELGDLDIVTDGGSADPGTIGEISAAEVAAPTAVGVGATGTWGSITSIALGAGVWSIFGVAALAQNSAVVESPVAFGISTSATGVGISQFAQTRSAFIVTDDDFQLPTPQIVVSIAAPATYYLNSLFNYSSGSPQHYGRIEARRIR
jgi:hypothetical protein